MGKINLTEKLALIHETWSPKLISQVGGCHVKLVKIKGEFVWHSHEEEEELFLVLEGRLLLRFRDQDFWLEPGELMVVPKGVEHTTAAEAETHLLVIEPATTVNTGDIENQYTQRELEWI